jgi:hypothetical protein
MLLQRATMLRYMHIVLLVFNLAPRVLNTRL